MLLLIFLLDLLIQLLMTSSLWTLHLLMINEHVDQKLGIVEVLWLLICQVSHDANLLKQLLGKMNDIVSLNLKVIEGRHS